MELCKCGCGERIILRPHHKYKPARYSSGHNIRTVNPISLLDKTKDARKNQTGFLGPKIVSNIRRDAIKAGYKWNLDDLTVFQLITKDCSYCGSPSNWPKKRNGIDRVDSNGGYDEKNCVSCCRFCNLAKSDKTLKEFVEWGERFYLNCLKNNLIKS